MELNNYPLAIHFEKAAENIKSSGKKLSNDELKPIYGLYKQATVGDNNEPEPSFYQITEKGKWKAWNEHKGKSKDQAKHEYVKEVMKHVNDDIKNTYI